MPRRLPGWGSVGTWSALTFVVSALICAAGVVMHLANEDALKQTTDAISDFRQSRLDVHQGMVDIRMSAFLQSDDQRNRGEHLLDQARERFLDSTKHAADHRSEFENLFGTFRSKLARSILPGSGREELAELLVALSLVQDLFADIEGETRRSLDTLEIEQNRILGLFVGGSIFLLLGMGTSAIASTRQRSAALAATRESEERFRRFFEMAPLPITYVDRSGNVLAINKKFATAFGYSHDEVRTVEDWRRLAYPDTAYREKIAVLRTIRQNSVATIGESASSEFSVTCKSGAVLDVVVTSTPLENGTLNTFQDITDIRGAERAIRDSEERFRRFFDMAPMPITYVDKAGNVLAINLKFAESFGYTHSEVPTVADFRQRVYPDPAYREQAIAVHAGLYARAGAAGSSESAQIRATCRNGQVREFVVTVTPLADGFLNTFQDITDIRQAERATRDSEARFRQIFDRSPVPKGFVDQNGKVVAVNRQFERVFGYSLSDIPTIDDWWRQAYPDRAYRETAHEIWDALIASAGDEIVQPHEFRVTCKDGSVRGVLVSGTRTEGGILATFVDISDRLAAEKALREEIVRSESARAEAEDMRARLEAALGAMSESVLIVDEAGEYVHFNDAFLRYHRFADRSQSPTTFDGFQPYIETMYADGTPITKDKRPVMRALAGETGIEHELRHRRKDTGETWTGLCNFAPIRNRTGRVVGAVVTARDITERRAAERQLAESQAQLAQAQKMEAVGQLTGGIAHDFNNLLAIIIGNLELLKAEASGTPNIEECADTALRASLRGAELTRRLLAFSRRQTLVPRRVELNALVMSMSSLIKRTLGENFRVETHLATDVDGVNVDPGQLESALLNLAVNARDAMPGGGTLTITTRVAELDEEYARNNVDVVAGTYEAIAVTDTGHGMSPDVMRHAFEPFFTTKEVGKGTGLGLSMVYGFAKQSRGHASIYSEPGRGTTVTIYLPRDAAPASTAARERSAADRPGEGEHLLVVEDNEDLRKLIRSQLLALGYAVGTASEGPEALARLADGPEPRLLLTDIAMPGGLDGSEVAAAARVRYPGIRILYMSGFAEGGSNYDRIEADGDGFLQKPFTKAQLSEAVAHALHKQGDAA